MLESDEEGLYDLWEVHLGNRMALVFYLKSHAFDLFRIPEDGYPTELAGSLPRPTYLHEAFADYDAGKSKQEDLVMAQDKAVEDSLKKLSTTGKTLIADGEQRASSFVTYPITDTPGGTGLSRNLAADGQYFAIFDDSHHRQLPSLISRPLKYKTYACDNLKNPQTFTEGKAMKQAIISPSMTYLLYPLNGDVEGYSEADFERETSSTNAETTCVAVSRQAPNASRSISPKVG